MSKLVQEKEEVKTILRSILVSSRNKMTINSLQKEFRILAGFQVPSAKFGFYNFEAFLRSIPDTVQLQPSGIVLPVVSDKSKHILDLTKKTRTKDWHSRKPVHHAPSMTVEATAQKPFISIAIRRKIAEYVTRNPRGVELHKLEKQLQITKWEQYGGARMLLSQLPHIARVVESKAYPVNLPTSKLTVEASEANTSQRAATKLVNQASEHAGLPHKAIESKVNHLADPGAVCPFKRSSGLNCHNTEAMTSVSAISEETKRHLLLLTKKYPDGIWCGELPQIWKNNYGKPLDVSEWGFDTVRAFALSLENSIVEIRKFGGHVIMFPKRFLGMDVATPLFRSPKMEQDIIDIYPADVAGPNFVLPQQNIPPNLKFCDKLEVVVAEVRSPTWFWLQLRGLQTTEALDELMDNIQQFYNADFYNDAYKIRNETCRALQLCVAPYSEEYHRVIINRIFDDEVGVSFVDYGTTGVVKKNTLKYIHKKFTELPAQAIRGKLANIQPAHGPNSPWTVEACKCFHAMVVDKPLIALVHTVDYQAKVLDIALVDTTGEDDVHINDILKREGYADYCKNKRESSRRQP